MTLVSKPRHRRVIAAIGITAVLVGATACGKLRQAERRER